MTTKKNTVLEKNEVVHPQLNGGKKFALPNWTFGKHKAVMRELSQLAIEDAEEKEEKFNNLVILNSLAEIGIKISEKQLEELHPNDRIELFNRCYLAGREGFKGDTNPFLPKTPKSKNQSSKK